jgi:glutamate synthase domain-containing protein 2
VATQDPALMAGLVVDDKATRVFKYHHATIHSACEIMSAIGVRFFFLFEHLRNHERHWPAFLFSF